VQCNIDVALQHYVAYIAFGMGRERLRRNRCGWRTLRADNMAAGPEAIRFDEAA